MIAWLQQNWGTLVICAVLVGVLAAIVAVRVRAKKQGRSSCGCGCSHCAMRESCHPDGEEK